MYFLMRRNFYKKICCVVLLLIAVPTLLFSEEKNKRVRSLYVGLEGGIQDLGVSYSYTSDKTRYFNTINLFLDTQGLFLGQKKGVGVTARYNYLFPIFNQERMSLYAGPGACLGYVTDIDSDHGMIFGLCATLGFRYQMERNISLGVHIHPTLGYKLDNESGYLKLRNYRAGLWRSILPNISVNYHFESTRQIEDPYKEKNFTLGIETSYNPTIYVYSHQMYIATEGYRYNYEKAGFDYFSNGELFLSAGYFVKETFKVNLLLGYAGISHNIRLLECNVRGGWYFKPHNHAGDRFFISLDAGIGLQTRDFTRPFAIGKIGLGYHIKIAPSSALEFFVRSAHHYASPLLYDEMGTEVPKNKALRSNLYINNIAFGISINI